MYVECKEIETQYMIERTNIHIWKAENVIYL